MEQVCEVRGQNTTFGRAAGLSIVAWLLTARDLFFCHLFLDLFMYDCFACMCACMCTTGVPGSYCVGLAGLELIKHIRLALKLTEIYPSASQVQKIKMCTTMLGPQCPL